MNEKSEFYTLKGYRLKNKMILTEAMEDYLEMIYRISLIQNDITIKLLSQRLNVMPSSVSKMCHKLDHLGYITFKRYHTIFLNEQGIITGKYLLYRHELIERLFRMINGIDFSLEQVEKIEHFLDDITLYHLEEYLEHNKNSS